MNLTFASAPLGVAELDMMWFYCIAIALIALVGVAVLIWHCLATWDRPLAQNWNSPYYGSVAKRRMPGPAPVMEIRATMTATKNTVSSSQVGASC